MPPTSLRVVEHGRRLEVIDTRAAHGISPVDPERPVAGRLLPRRTRFDGSSEWTTHAFYDDKAPRTVPLAPGAVALAGWTAAAVAVALVVLVVLGVGLPLVMIAGGALAGAKTRRRLRAWTTKGIDRLAGKSR